MDKREILAGFQFFQKSPVVWQRRLLRESQPARLSAGQFFYHEGDASSGAGLVGTGSIRVFKIGDTGREITLYHVHDNEPCLVNMLSVFLDRPAMATAQAETAVEAVVIPAVTARGCMEQCQPMRHFVLETMAHRVMEVMTLAEEIAFRKMDRRVAEWLLRRFERLRVIRATHEEIAAELGTAREVVSRLLKDLERLGAIQLNRGQIVLRDESRLREVTGENHRSVTKSRKTARQKS